MGQLTNKGGRSGLRFVSTADVGPPPCPTPLFKRTSGTVQAATPDAVFLHTKLCLLLSTSTTALFVGQRKVHEYLRCKEGGHIGTCGTRARWHARIHRGIHHVRSPCSQREESCLMLAWLCIRH